MQTIIYDFVKRMTGGNEAVAGICASMVADLEKGDVCRWLCDDELAVMQNVPCVAARVERTSEPLAVETPFVISGHLLYTRRNWVYEHSVADRIKAMSASVSHDDVSLPDTPFYGSLREEQRHAVTAMCRSRFSILTGGPGTGKTHTIARAVTFLNEMTPGMKLVLAAPTGKAAARMTESIRHAGVAADEAMTVHRLLEMNPGQMTVARNASNPLNCDWLIIDEASMIGLPLMYRILDALPENCRLTLVGDADQLASVERGRIFADLCTLPGITLCRLCQSERFKADGEIARLSAAVNSGQCRAAMDILKERNALVDYADISESRPYAPEKWPRFIDLITRQFAELSVCAEPVSALAHVNDFRILCALRNGPFGVAEMNRLVQNILGSGSPVPMLITQNNDALEVANGDVGVVLPGDKSTLWLPGNTAPRPVRIELLPEIEPAFASTVHKSQGSEFQNVAIILPPVEDSPLLTREILYTAITRTRNRIAVYASDAAVARCCRRRVQRVSGLVPQGAEPLRQD